MKKKIRTHVLITYGEQPTRMSIENVELCIIDHKQITVWHNNGKQRNDIPIALIKDLEVTFNESEV